MTRTAHRLGWVLVLVITGCETSHDRIVAELKRRPDCREAWIETRITYAYGSAGPIPLTHYVRHWACDNGVRFQEHL
jgi:hypothetical protein